jgi:hypothetical protein
VDDQPVAKPYYVFQYFCRRFMAKLPAADLAPDGTD